MEASSMHRSFARHLFAILLFLVLISLACSVGGPSAQTETSYRYDDLPAAGQEDPALSKYRAISQWGKTDITYYFINGTDKINGSSEEALVIAAFKLWSDQTPLTFTEVSDPDQADILIGWAKGEHGDGDPFDGPGDVLAHASYPNPYSDRRVFLHFDDSERWLDSETRNVDLLTVAAHEIGHNLGLDHSDDPGALMFAAYAGPHRFLDEDDIAGVQSLYGLAAEPAEGPEIPSQGETPPPSASQDSDRDGISDDDEILRTGTDPQKQDTDGDRLGDGVEVANRMNPLDPDMDRDGVSDGQEVAQGTNPLLPDQNVNISPELSEEVSEFLTEAIELQIKAYQDGDASIAASILTGDLLATMEDEIAALNQQGLVQISEIDYYQSYIDDIRVISNTHLEVDSCEVWSTDTWRRSDGTLVQSIEPRLLPQTITIQKLSRGWFITDVEFFSAPAFCDA
jgi:hypothetical protein